MESWFRRRNTWTLLESGRTSARSSLVDQAKQSEFNYQGTSNGSAGVYQGIRGNRLQSDRQIPLNHSLSSLDVPRVPSVSSVFTMPRPFFKRFMEANMRRSVPYQSVQGERESIPEVSAYEIRRTSEDEHDCVTGNEPKRVRLSRNDHQRLFAHQSQNNLRIIEQKLREKQSNLKRDLLNQLRLHRAQKIHDMLQCNNAFHQTSIPLHYPTMDRNMQRNSYLPLSHRLPKRILQRRHSHTIVNETQSGFNRDSAQAVNHPCGVPGPYGARVIMNTSCLSEGESHSFEPNSQGGYALDHLFFPKIVAVHSTSNKTALKPNHCVGSGKEMNMETPTATSRFDEAHEENEIPRVTVERRIPRLRQEVGPRPITEDRNNAETDVRTIANRKRTYDVIDLTKNDEVGKKNVRMHQWERKDGSGGDVNLAKRANESQKMRLAGKVSQKRGSTGSHVRLLQCAREEETGSDGKNLLKRVNESQETRLAETTSCKRNVPQSEQGDETESDNNLLKRANESQETGHIENVRQKQDSPGTVDLELDFGGPPLYLPLIEKSEKSENLGKQDENPASRRRNSSKSTSPTPPQLTKTIPEINDKLIETRERIRNETIDWKKKILYRLEKVLMKKLRRVENKTGEKSQIEEVREEGEEDVGGVKKNKGQSHARRRSRQQSVRQRDEPQGNQDELNGGDEDGRKRAEEVIPGKRKDNGISSEDAGSRDEDEVSCDPLQEAERSKLELEKFKENEERATTDASVQSKTVGKETYGEETSKVSELLPVAPSESKAFDEGEEETCKERKQANCLAEVESAVHINTCLGADKSSSKQDEPKITRETSVDGNEKAVKEERNEKPDLVRHDETVNCPPSQTKIGSENDHQQLFIESKETKQDCETKSASLDQENDLLVNKCTTPLPLNGTVPTSGDNRCDEPARPQLPREKKKSPKAEVRTVNCERNIWDALKKCGLTRF